MVDWVIELEIKIEPDVKHSFHVHLDPLHNDRV